MITSTHLLYLAAFVAPFLISAALTYLMRRLAPRLGFVDQPGERKMHTAPMPLMGGVAIVATFYLFVLSHLLVFALLSPQSEAWLKESIRTLLGVNGEWKLAGFLSGGLLIFFLGVVDDFRALGPRMKLAGQIAAAAVLVLSGIHLEVFVLSNVWLSAAATIFWVVLITNSMNLLDNMDGLCGGVSIISALSFFLCVQPVDVELVRWLLLIFAGAMGGFLYHNLSPAKIFMGDSGAMFSGYFLASISLLGTYHVEATPSKMSVAAPLLALAVPLFDTSSVIYIRWSSGQPIMRGDKRHFSHRLVDLGMTPRRAVEFIFLVAGVVGLGGALLPVLDQWGTLVILAQTAGIFLLIILLMRIGRLRTGERP